MQILKTITLPKKIKFLLNYSKSELLVKGPLGQILIKNVHKKRKQKKMFFNLILASINGVLSGFVCKLHLIGIGNRVHKISLNTLILKLGYSHLIKFKIPLSIRIASHKRNSIVVFGINIFEFKNFIYEIRKKKFPCAYKGHGIRLKNEKILIKQGKKNK